MKKVINTSIIGIILFVTMVSCHSTKNRFQEKKGSTNYFSLLKDKKWYYTDGPTGIVKYPDEYHTYDEKYEYYYSNDSLYSKDVYHFSNDCNFDSTKIGKVKFGKYMVMPDDLCSEVESISDSTFTFWSKDIGRFHILEVK